MSLMPARLDYTRTLTLWQGIFPPWATTAHQDIPCFFGTLHKQTGLGTGRRSKKTSPENQFKNCLTLKLCMRYNNMCISAEAQQ